MSEGALSGETDAFSGGWTDTIARVVAAADPNVLRMVLFLYTRDHDLLQMKVHKTPVRAGVSYRYALSPEDAAAVRSRACVLLSGMGSVEAISAPARPSEAETREMIDALVGERLSDLEFSRALEELALDEFPRDVPERLASLPKESLEGVHVAIIGAGVTGIVLGTMLGRAGVPYTVFERQADLGGTWEANTYPEARCDVPVFLYQYRFEKNYPWKDHQPAQRDLKEYLKHVAQKHGVTEHVRLSTEVERATWSQDKAKWELLIDEGGEKTSFEADFLIHGGSFFGTPKRPDIDGLETFAGPAMHTAEWDHTVQLDGKRIGIIGSGSSGTQLMPYLAEHGTSLTLFHRTPHWVMPSENYKAPLSAESRWLLDHLPYYWNWFCLSYFMTSRQDTVPWYYDRAWQARGGLVSRRNDEIRAAATEFMRKKFADRPDLFEKLVPSYAPYARRNVVDSGWYDALLRDNVELMTEPIRRIVPQGIETADGVVHELDVLILATGFDVHRWFWPVSYTGRDGQTFDQLWANDGARSYLGLMMPGFPNMFAYHGPNGAPMFGGYHSWTEMWTRYVLDVIALVVERGSRAFDVRRDVYDRYNTKLDEEFERLVVQGEHGGGGYFVDKAGRAATALPWDALQYFDWIRHATPDDFDIW